MDEDILVIDEYQLDDIPLTFKAKTTPPKEKEAMPVVSSGDGTVDQVVFPGKKIKMCIMSAPA